MNTALADEISRLGGEPSDEVWSWLATRGPQGPSFSWGQTKGNPAGYVGVQHLEQVVDGLELSIPAFRERARRAIQAAMASRLPELARRAIQVASVLGGEAELRQVQALASSPEPSVAADAKACAFLLKRRI